MKVKTRVTMCAIMLFATLLSLNAQTASSGAIVGTVTDASEAVIPGATVEATSTALGQTRTVTTGANGSYRFSLLPPGDYSVKFSANGFKTAHVQKITVEVTESPTLDQKLELGSQTEQITVEANAETLQTNSAALGGTVSGQAVVELPLTTRNYTNIMAMSAGIAANVVDASQLGVAGMNIRANGASTQSNNISMDGQNIQNVGQQNSGQSGSFSAGGYSPVPSPDAIQEFKVQTSTYDAAYGRGIGANVNVITKSGSNAFHGSAFEFFRNTVLNANDFFLNLNGKPKGILNQNQFGGVLGGPVKKDKLFFFFSYQGTVQKNGLSGGSSNVTLPPIPQGDRSNTAAFRQALGALNCPANNPGQAAVYTTVRGGVQVACDGSNINDTAIRILQTKFPSGPQAGQLLVPGSTAGGFQNTIYSTAARFREDQYMGNVDHVINNKHTLGYRVFFSNAPANLPFQGASSVPGFGAPYKYRNYNNTVKLTSVLTNSIVNEGRINFNRSESGTLLDESGLTWNSLGIAPLSPGIPSMGIFNITGVGSIGPSGTQLGPAPADTYGLGDQISWTKGKHTIRAGGETSDYRFNWNLLALGLGTVNFGTFSDFLIGRSGCPPTSTTCDATNPGNTNGTQYSNITSTNTADVMGSAGNAHAYRQRYSALFITDDWKLSRRLTLNVGVRWERPGGLSDAHGVLTNVWPSAILKQPTPPTASCVPQCSYYGWVEPSNYPKEGVYGYGAFNLPGLTIADNKLALNQGLTNKAFAPRFGFAFQPLEGGKLVIRGGFGVMYDFVPAQSYVFGINNAPPLANAIGKSQTANYFANLAAPFFAGQLGKFQDRFVNFQTLETSAIGQQIFPENSQIPTALNWNLNVQYNFLPRWVLELGYVGNRTYHINNSGGVQDIGSVSAIASPSRPVNGVTTNSVANSIVRVPYLGFQSLRVQCTCFELKYNSFQATVRKQLSNGLRFEAAYTWARSMTTAVVTQETNRLQSNYGISTQIRPHRLILNYSYVIPANVSGFAGKLVNGWQLSGVTTVQGGTPLTITDNRGGTIFGNFSTAGALARANFASGKTHADIATPGDVKQRLGGLTRGCGYYTSYQAPASATLNGVSCASLSAFAAIPTYVTPEGVVTNGTGWGNAGIGVIYGPGQVNFDASLIKTTRVGGLTEQASLQFRAEFFNLMNHAQFGNPSTGLQAAGTFGQITGNTVSPRVIQLALKYVF